MAALARLNPFYVSLFVTNNSTDLTYDSANTPNATVVASVNDTYDIPLIEKASDYLVTVERFELTLNGIPFYDATTGPAEYIRVVELPGLAINQYPIPRSVFSVGELFDVLNAMAFVRPVSNTPFAMIFTMDKDGYVIMNLVGTAFNATQIRFPRRLNWILGISTLQQTPLLGGLANTRAQSLFPRGDMGDDLNHLILRTTLPTKADTLGNFKTSIMTDFSVPSVCTNIIGYGPQTQLVDSGLSLNMRQRAIYVPNEKRMLKLTGDFPIHDITIDAYYVNEDHTLKRVNLPFGGRFEVKLGFYLKS